MVLIQVALLILLSWAIVAMLGNPQMQLFGQKCFLLPLPTH